MSNTERNIAFEIVTNLSSEQVTKAEESRPGFELKFNALKRHLSAQVPDEKFVLNQIAIRSLVQSILGDSDTYQTAIRLENLREVYSRFDQILGDFYKQIDERFNTELLSEPANAKKPFIKYLREESVNIRNGLI